MDPFSAIMGLVGLVTGLKKLADGSTAPPEPKKPPAQFVPMGQSAGVPPSQSRLSDPGSSTQMQDPTVRTAALDRFRQMIGA